jgi:SAM-dependent methyltransferase
MEIPNNCPLCSREAKLSYADLPGYKEPHKFNIYHCSFCNTSYSFPKVETDSIYDLIYKNGAVAPGYHRYWKLSEDIKRVKDPLKYLTRKEMTYWAASKAIHEYSRKVKDPKILEVGSGLGYLTYAFKTAGFNITGLEISRTAVKIAKEKYGDFYINADLFKYSKDNEGTYDMVLLTEVIEHVEDITSFISALSKLVKPEGRLIITTPNKSFYPEDTIWVSDLPPVHLWWLSEKSVKFIAGKLNLKLSFVDFTDFYRRNYTPMRIDVNKKIPGRDHVFNSNGKLIKSKKQNVLQKILNELGRTLTAVEIFRICHKNLRQTFLKVRYYKNPNIKCCGHQTHIMCAVLEKNNIIS